MIYGGHFEVERKESEIKELESEMLNPNFWNDKNKSEEIISKLNALKNKVDTIKDLKNKIDSNIEDINSITEEDIDILNIINEDIIKIKNTYDKFELDILLNGPYDNNNCILEIHAGAGGTESCDWANMLYRMYTRYAELKNYKIQIIDTIDGEEAGIKSVYLLVSGYNAYGYLKCEKGVHRLVRLSPFDSNNRRHTSFASVEVTPEINNDVDIDIQESDLKIDVYRSSGAGGQHVNTTDSAVRITHIPTKIVVTCQNDRSQIKNRETALKVLKSKLIAYELQKQEEEINKLKGGQMSINFGSQIRSYVMHPYSLVKDHRTNVETSNVSKVLDGELDMFIEAYLKEGVK